MKCFAEQATFTPTSSPSMHNHSTTSRASKRPNSKLMPDSVRVSSVRIGGTEKGCAHGHVVGYRKSPSVNMTSTCSINDHTSEKDANREDDNHDGTSTPTP